MGRPARIQYHRNRGARKVYSVEVLRLTWVCIESDGITIGFRREAPPSAVIYIGQETPCGPRLIGVELGDLMKWHADPSWGAKRRFLGMISGGCPEQGR